MKTWIIGNKVPSRKEQALSLWRIIHHYFWKKLGFLFRKDFINEASLRKRMASQMALVLAASTLVGIFFQAPSSNAVNVEDCSAIGQLRNGGFEFPTTSLVVDDANSTYPASSVTAAQQNSTGTNANAVYGPVYNDWNHLDASADGSTYRTYELSGRSGDARVYWNTTEASEQIEFGSFVSPQAGSRFAELNANVRAALYQDIPTIPGVTIRWSLAHRGRDGTDTMQVYIGKPSNSATAVRSATSRYNASAQAGNSTLQSLSTTRTNSARGGLSLASAFPANSSTSSTNITDDQSWRFWYGTYEENSSTTTNTRFLFESVSPEGSTGNLLDAITFAPVAACPITRLYNSPTETQTVNIFDTNAGSFAMVPDEPGHAESVTALTHVDGPGRATINSGGRSLTFTPNGSGVTTFDYTIRYVANGIASTSDGRITITARDVFGQASCSPGAVETSTATINGQLTVIETFQAPAQANTDNDSDHRSATCTWTVPEGVFAVDYLVVGGGGGGSSGGGGGGGVVTSWSTSQGTSTSTQRTALRNPLAVTPGEVVNVTVGGGGKPGWGGSLRCTYSWNGVNSTSNSCTNPTRIPTRGSDSAFGSVNALGGGFGGGSGQAGGGDGGSGGGSRFDSSASSGSAAASQVVGATSFGNPGGGSSGGSYQAGGGGGGAGTSVTVSTPPSSGNGGIGGNIRSISSNGGNNGDGRVLSGTTAGGGGHGGRGVMTDIASFTGTFREYGCGGGGGINDNSNNVIAGAGGSGGCSSAGNGSNFATFLTTRANSMPAFNNDCSSASISPSLGSDCSSNRITSTQFNGTTVPTAGFGGGGGGTDPEGDIAGSGGSGVVVIRYVVSNISCPNSSNSANVTGPIACPYPITISAGASVSTFYDLSYGDATNGYVSFPGGATDTVTVTTTISNGIDTVTVTIRNGNEVAFSVSNATTALAGATYPMRYTIYSGSASSTAFVLLRIVDPDQATPVVIPVDPRATEVDLSSLRIGGSQMTQVCFTPIADDDTPGYSNIPTVDRTTNRSTESRTVTASIGRLRLQGTSANLQQAVRFIRVTKSETDTVLIPGTVSRRIAVNVSNGTVGGNGSCTFGNESIIELRPMAPAQIIRRNDVELKPNR